MDKILFIVPPCIRFEDFIHPKSNARFRSRNNKLFGNVLADMPIGVMSLSSYVKKHVKTTKTKLVDFNIVLNKMDDFDYENFGDFFKEVLLLRSSVFIDFMSVSVCFSNNRNEISMSVSSD